MNPRFPPQLKVRGLFAAAPVRLVLALTMACLAAGCEEEWDPQPVEASQSAIRFDHPDFDPDLAEYAHQRYRMGHRAHVARFSGADAFAVLAVFRPAAGYVVPERVLESEVGRLLDGADVDWGVSGRSPSGLGYVRYRMFRLVDQPFNCVGFSDTSDERNYGSGRRSDLVTGVFCYDESRPLSATTAADLIRQVSVR
jgi:hypothetical protein